MTSVRAGVNSLSVTSPVRFHKTSGWLVLFWLTAASLSAFGQGAIPEPAAQQMRALMAEKLTRNPAQTKLDSQIHYAAKVRRGLPIADGIRSMSGLESSFETGGDGLIHVDIKAQVNDALLGSIAALGGRVENAVARYDAIRAWIPLLAAETLAARSDVMFIRPAALGRTNTGPDTNGVKAHAADVVQAEGYAGAGIKIGVLSNGVDSLSSEEQAGNLPTVTVLPGQAGTGDEGTAMLEIVHSMAPGALLYFATGGDQHRGTG